ncbi:rhomboid family intramembrane serine protease [candidate division KSB1 bacterium]|nr:rhomboid family intramembrane serine protease [candidate division KSB1 bacterium]
MDNYRRIQWGMGGGGIPDMVKYLLIANGAMYFLQMFTGPSLIYILGLVPKLAWSRFHIWQLATYMFLHGGILHIALNMYALYIFGSEVERMWGPKAFLRYYFITGIGAGLIHTLLMPMSTVPTIGASGAVLGVLTAFAIMFPDREITLLLFFILPVTLKARTLAIGYAVISLFSGASGSPDGIAHFAHLGGMLVGYLYLKRGSSLSGLKTQYTQWRRRRNMRVHREHEEELEKLRRLADAVLDKANAVGMKNLTKDEKLILKRASQVLKNNEKYNSDL